MDNMANNKYVSLKKGLSGYASLVKADEVLDIIGNDSTGINTDWYQSVFYYNDEHLKHHKEKGNLRGITNVKTDKLVIDFDDASNPNNARIDAVELTKRLKSQGVKEKDIEIYFSGNKGFHVIVTLKKEITPRQAELAANKLTKDLKTFDSSLYDAAQILRVPWTKNKSGLYKVPITSEQLNTTIDKIKEIAKDINNVDETKFHWQATDAITDDFFTEPIKEKKEISLSTNVAFDMVSKPRHWPDYKWALLNAYMVKPEERHESLMVISATCRGLGYPEDMTRALCLTFDEKFTKNTGKPPVEDLDTNILSTVYGTHWSGGTYSIKNNIWLQNYAKRIGTNPDLNEDEPVVSIESAFSIFKDYATNIDSLTVKTGIPSLDKRLRMTIGMSVGLVGAPGSGKSTIALQMLNAMSNANEDCIFFSYDMYSALVFQKLAQKHLNISDKELFEKFKNNDYEFQEQVLQVLKKEYKTVQFCFKTGQTPEEIEKTILFTKEKTGKIPRLIVVDYSELVLSDMSDSTSASAYVAHKLREIANKYNTCVFVLLQPNKMAGTPADEITSYQSAKGSSTIQQSLSVMLGMSRPGYDPKHAEDDQFVTINCLKNRMGPLFSLDLGWSGANSSIYELTDEQRSTLAAILKAKEESSKEEDEGWK